jgi:hypothetical protein
LNNPFPGNPGVMDEIAFVRSVKLFTVVTSLSAAGRRRSRRRRRRKKDRSGWSEAKSGRKGIK